MSTTNQEPVKQRPLSSREEMMAAISSHRNAEFTKETGIEIVETAATVDPDIDPEHAAAEAARRELEAAALQNNGGEGDDTQLELQRQQEAAAQQQQDDAARAAADATQRAQAAAGIDPGAKLRLKVNGREVEITGEEALRRLQKDVSAEQLLAEASRKENEAHRLLREAQEQQAALQQAQREPRQAARQEPTSDDEAIDNTVSALFEGDAGKAKAALKAALTAARQEGANAGRGNAAISVDHNAIAAQVRQQMSIDSALEQSRRDYPELYADPDVEAVAAARITRMVNEGTPFVAALGEVQADFAAKFGWKRTAGGTTPLQQQSNRREEKLARKESLEATPVGPSVKTATHEVPQANVHDAIREIAKARGQSVVS